MAKQLIGPGTVAANANQPTALVAMHGRHEAAWAEALALFQRLQAEHNAACDAYSAIEERYYAERPQQRMGAECLVGDTVDTYHERLHSDRAEFERLDAECRKTTGFDAVQEAQERAGDAAWEALGDLLGTPAPGLEEAALKIELATEHGRRIDDLAAVVTDLRRLHSQGRA